MSEMSEQKTGADIDYGLFLDCVHCGLCTSSCPTYVTTGDENDSPRGRIHLMRGVVDGRLELTPAVQQHLALCLDCRACETACPSGVQYGRLIEPFRLSMQQETHPVTGGQSAKNPATDDWFHRWILFGVFPYRDRLQWVLAPAQLMKRLGVIRLLEFTRLDRLMPERLRRLTQMLPRPSRPQPPLPASLPAKGKRRARVALFLGCVGDAMFRETNWATARVLQENGCDVVIPQGQTCCGAIHFHAANEAPAREFADVNVDVFDTDGIDAIIVNVAGCGAMLKEYGLHWMDGETTRRRQFADRVRDVHEFLDELGLRPPSGVLPIKATYHDACHLAHAQQVRAAPRNLLSQIPGLELVDLPESDLCCGAAGTYNLTQPKMADQLGKRKGDNIVSTGARLLVTGNAGCHLQIARELRLRGETISVKHPMDLLDLSYRGQSLEAKGMPIPGVNDLRARFFPTKSLGQRGEAAAARFLRGKRYKIIAQGERGAVGELDLVAVDGRTVVFVEVKTRKSHDAGHPTEAVDGRKQAKLSVLALSYLKRHNLLECPARFDVVAVTWPDNARQPTIEHYENAFEVVGRGQMFS